MHFYETLLSNEPFQPNTSTKKSDLLKIRTFSDEATYIYSLEKKKIVAADGWLQLLGYANSEINMHLLVSITSPDFKEFILEMNNQALAFILSKSENLHTYSCTIESKKISKTGSVVSLIESVRVFKSSRGKVLEVIGNYKLNPRISHPGNKYFQASGPGIESLVEKMQQFQAHEEVVNKRERKIIRMLANGKTVTEVANEILVSKSTVEKILSELCRKFKVNNRAELIAYSQRNEMI